jgi:phenylacetate-CoA ligase
MTLYNFILKKALLPASDLISRQHVMQFYNFYAQSQKWDIEKLHDIQNKNFTNTINTAYREVPFYKNLYDQYKIDIKHINTVDNLRELPVITKEMLRNAYPHSCTRETGQPWHEYCTSGSSGRPFAVRVDNMTMSHARALMLLRANFSGWEIGDPFLQTGMTLDRGIEKYVKDKLLRVEYVSAFDLSNAMLDSYLELIETKNIKYIMGYPGSVYFMAQRAKEIGYERKMKGIVTWGDNLYQHFRTMIETQFCCRVTDTYGCGEGIQVAAQCKRGNYHIFMPHVAVEIVDAQGNPVPDGELGSIILTRLDPGVMPLIRYSVGDVGRKSADAECACGRRLEILSSIEGRDTDIIETPNGNRLIVHFFTGIFEYYQSIDTFKVTQKEKDGIIIQIVPRSNFDKEELEKIKQEIWVKGDRDLKIQFELVDEIPIEKSNKRRFVISYL